MDQYILALDQGTTSSRAIIFDRQGQIKATAQKEFEQLFPKSGWVEHDPNEIWSTQAAVAAEATVKAGLNGKNIAAIGITNQRETTIVWDRETGDPIHNAIVWQDRRTAEYCNQLKAEGHGGMIQEKTGLVIDAYFSGSKIKWMLDNVPGARQKAEAGKLAFGTVDSWLIWKFSRGKIHVTDATNASRTMLYNIRTHDWDDELLELLTIPRSMLPEVKSSSEVYGETATTLFASKVPIAGIAGDQQAALFGQMCVDKGMVKNTYGTGCFMLMNIGEQFIPSKNNLLTTIAMSRNGRVTYALEGSIFIAGAVVQWLRDGFQLISSSSAVETLAQQVDNNDGVYFVPAFAGLGAPYWNQEARGTMVGLSRGTQSGHIARAALESMAFQTMDVLNAMEADAGTSIKELRVDGGASGNNLMMQFQSDLLNSKVIRPRTVETTALGAAYLAGLAVGYWQNTDEIKDLWSIDQTFFPQMEQRQVDALKKGWKRAIDTTQYWANYQ